MDKKEIKKEEAPTMHEKGISPIIIALALIAAFALLFIFLGSTLYPIISPYSINTDQQEKPKVIVVSSIGKTLTIDNQENVIELVLSAKNDVITITKETRISEIRISGADNIINLCEGIHNPEKISDTGRNNKVNYLPC